jgi:hypothetical protein
VNIWIGTASRCVRRGVLCARGAPVWSPERNLRGCKILHICALVGTYRRGPVSGSFMHVRNMDNRFVCSRLHYNSSSLTSAITVAEKQHLKRRARSAWRFGIGVLFRGGIGLCSGTLMALPAGVRPPSHKLLPCLFAMIRGATQSQNSFFNLPRRIALLGRTATQRQKIVLLVRFPLQDSGARSIIPGRLFA